MKLLYGQIFADCINKLKESPHVNDNSTAINTLFPYVRGLFPSEKMEHFLISTFLTRFLTGSQK